jgi:hypothetical protein
MEAAGFDAEEVTVPSVVLGLGVEDGCIDEPGLEVSSIVALDEFS